MNLVLTRGEGVQNPENLADVICKWPLMLSLSLHLDVVDSAPSSAARSKSATAMGLLYKFLRRCLVRWSKRHWQLGTIRSLHFCV